MSDCTRISVQEGGRWGSENRGAAIKTVTGLVREYFEKDNNADAATVHWVTRLQNILSFSKTEQASYDFKQGFLLLSAVPKFDEKSFSKILETCVGISNIGPHQKGYVLIGIAENSETALRIEEKFGVKPIKYEDFYVMGIEHEATSLDKSVDKLFQYIAEKIRQSSISEPLKSYICSNMKSVRYFDRTVFVLEIAGQLEPSLLGEKYFERKGAQLFEVGAKDFSALYSRFSRA